MSYNFEHKTEETGWFVLSIMLNHSQSRIINELCLLTVTARLSSGQQEYAVRPRLASL